MKYQIIEKIDADFLSAIIGLTKDAVEELFVVGDNFKIKQKQFKIIHKTKEKDKTIFICHVWN